MSYVKSPSWGHKLLCDILCFIRYDKAMLTKAEGVEVVSQLSRISHLCNSFLMNYAFLMNFHHVPIHELISKHRKRISIYLVFKNVSTSQMNLILSFYFWLEYENIFVSFIPFQAQMYFMIASINWQNSITWNVCCQTDVKCFELLGFNILNPRKHNF